ncbi:unnamed protein product [Clonostachys rhizophaga]|uniref:Uncharacterized protein n=1 Tax=Clonostachys rhizophaga TaxID=160324 RepID=A0A9N9VE57_9HYPO|nr:unnamed protein product [Clonostachys rhizophaga]
MNNTTSGIYSNDQMRKWDAIVRSGWPVVISSNSWAISIALITLLYQLVAARLFRPYAMGLFWLLSEDHRAWDVDQVRVAMANTMSPLTALLSKPAYRILISSFSTKYRLARSIALLWLLGALSLAREIPVVQGVPGSTDDCILMPNFTNWMASAQYDGLLSVDMLRSADVDRYNYTATNAASVGLPNNKDRVVISSDCPEWAPICDRSNPLRIDIDFWLKQSDLGIGSRARSEHVEFGVLNTCYKLEIRTKVLQTEEDGTNIYGLLYGTDHNLSDFVTDKVNPGKEAFGYGYNLFPHFNTSGDSTKPLWTPNDTLAHYGDRTLLFYHLGGIFSPSPSSDPIFGTNTTPIEEHYIYLHRVIPVICNTSYAYCPREGGDCFSLGGTDAVGKYSKSKGLGFLELMWANTWISLFSTVTHSSESVYASRTLSFGTTQLAPGEVSGHAEIIRLVLASRVLLLTSAKRAVSDWRRYVSWSLPEQTTKKTESLLETCRLTLMEDPAHITTSARALLIVVLIGSVPLLLSFTGPMLRYFLWRRLCVFTIRWRLRTAPHLHRTTLERGDPDRFWPGDVADEWPVGRGCADEVGLVESYTGYHAVYRPDAELRYMPKHRPRRADV